MSFDRHSTKCQPINHQTIHVWVTDTEVVKNSRTF